MELNSKQISDLTALIDKVASSYRNQLQMDGINASGNLAQFTTEYTCDDSHFILYFNLEEYWYYVENGRNAGRMPPIDVIEQWINVKPIIPVPDIKGRIPTTRQLAFLIARKIGRYGYEGRHPLAKTVLSTEMDDIVDGIKSVLVSGINEEIKKEINNIKI